MIPCTKICQYWTSIGVIRKCTSFWDAVYVCDVCLSVSLFVSVSVCLCQYVWR